MKWFPVILLLLGTIGLVTAAYMYDLTAGVAATGLALVTAGVAAALGKWWSVPFMLLYAAGFGSVVFIGLWQAWQTRQASRAGSAEFATRNAEFGAGSS